MKSYLVTICFLSSQLLFGQTLPFTVSINPKVIKNFPALHSMVIAEHDGDWLIIGGRKDGLHGRRPFDAFDEENRNTNIYVVNKSTGNIWRQSVSKLPFGLATQLSSSNMQFYQDGKTLYITGGYGYDPELDEHLTFPFLITINVDKLVNDVKQGRVDSTVFHRFYDKAFAETGGRLGKIADTFLLASGHNFFGRYNPIGPDHGPGFEQQYSNSIKRFMVNAEGVKFIAPIYDPILMHKRDFNFLPSVAADGSKSYTAFSGVFQYNIDMPFTNLVDYVNNSLQEQKGFSQYLNHYHSAAASLTWKSEMYHVFFGGIAQYVLEKDTLVCDPDVPFVKTVSLVKRNADGTAKEYQLPLQMPDYLGSASEFLPNSELQQTSHGVIIPSDKENGKLLLGYIVGGIRSTRDNVFWDDEKSYASSKIFEVYADFSKPMQVKEVKQSTQSVRLQAYTYKEDELLYVFNNGEPTSLKVEILNRQKKLLLRSSIPSTAQYKKFKVNGLSREKFVFLRVSGGGEAVVQMVLVK